MKRNGGWTIIQTMLALLAAGVMLALAADFLIDHRCEENPARQMCAQR